MNNKSGKKRGKREIRKKQQDGREKQGGRRGQNETAEGQEQDWQDSLHRIEFFKRKADSKLAPLLNIDQVDGPPLLNSQDNINIIHFPSPAF